MPDNSFTWTGACRNGRLAGKGIRDWIVGGRLDQSHDGEFDDGKRNGAGTTRLTDGTVMSGEFANDKLNGFGRIIFPRSKMPSLSYWEGKGVWENDTYVISGLFKDSALQLKCTSKELCVAAQRRDEAAAAGALLGTAAAVAVLIGGAKWILNAGTGSTSRASGSDAAVTGKRYSCDFLCRGSLFASGLKHSVAAVGPDETTTRESLRRYADDVCFKENRGRAGAWWADMSICTEK